MEIEKNFTNKEIKRGFAPIKKEFLKTTWKENIELKIKEYNNEMGDQKSKPKMRGMNRKRPREKKPTGKDKICPSILKSNICSYGNQCKFSHDVEKFLLLNQDDIPGRCYSYDTKGFCSCGISCVFRNQHMNINYENIINCDFYNKYNKEKEQLNQMSKNLLIKLRKNEYIFEKAKEISVRKNSFNKNENKKFIYDHKKNKEKSENENDEKRCNNEKGENKEEKEKDEKKEKEECEEKIGCIIGEEIGLRNTERKKIIFKDKLYLAPLTTVGNLPFRRICKNFGADVTCGEMALAPNLLQGQASEWALIKRHPSEDLFGVQLCGTHGNLMARAAEIITKETKVDFIDINIGCPLDFIFNKGDGSALMGRWGKLEHSIKSMAKVTQTPLTLKMRTGFQEGKPFALKLVAKLKHLPLSLLTIHGRSREQRYTKMADWSYIGECAHLAHPLPLFGNGDILSYEDYYNYVDNYKVDGAMIARGALIKPWIFKEIKEKRVWDIRGSERLEVVRDFCNYGLEHWGSDKQGVANTRRFLLEWLSFAHRYIPVALLEHLPQKINQKPQPYVARDYLETLLSSPNSSDWIKITEMFLGKVPKNFAFLPKHKANSY